VNSSKQEKNEEAGSLKKAKGKNIKAPMEDFDAKASKSCDTH